MTKTLTEQQIRKIIENGTRKAAKVCKQKFYDKPKSLTEQWRDGTIQEGFYYMQDYTGRYCYRYLLGVKPDADFVKCFKEVLAPVPSYDHFSQLVKKVERLQEQLTEANNIIVKADWDCDYTLQSKCGFSDYLKKYDVRGIK